MKKLTIIMLVTLMIVGIGTTTFAGRGGRGGGSGMGGHGKGGPGMGRGGQMHSHPLLTSDWGKIVEIADKAGITENQLDELSELRNEFREATGDVEVDLRNKREAFHELMVTATASDKSKAMKMAEEVHALQGQLMKSGLEATFKIKTIFTGEQLEKLKEVAKERMQERREDRKEKRQGRGEGRGGMRQPGGNW